MMAAILTHSPSTLFTAWLPRVPARPAWVSAWVSSWDCSPARFACTGTSCHDVGGPSPWLLVEFAFVSILFSINSWIVLLASLCCEPIALGLAKATTNADDTPDDSSATTSKTSAAKYKIAVVISIVLLPVLLLVAASASSLYLDPFYRGCQVYWSDQVADLADGSLLSNDDHGGNERRRLEVCAQFCVSNAVMAPLVPPATRAYGLSSTIARAQCSEQGYEIHFLIKTFAYLSCSLDVELYYPDGYDNSGSGEGE